MRYAQADYAIGNRLAISAQSPSLFVRFRNQFNVGKIECEMVTFNEKSHWVFPLVPTAGDYAKLNTHFGEAQNSKIEILVAQGDFGETLSTRKVLRA